MSTVVMDLNPLIRLKDALEGAEKNTSKMLLKLEKFEQRLTTLDEKMKPIQKATSHYTKAKENISLTLIEVNKTYEYFRIANEVKAVIHKGLNSNTQEQYFNALNRLSNAKSFFENHLEIKSASNALTNIDVLQTTAVTACVSEFEKLLLTADKSLTINADGHYNIVNPLTPEVSKELKALCEVLELNRYSDHFRVYQNVRITKIKIELKKQEDLYSKDWAATQLDTPYEKGTHPFKDYFILVYWLLRSELQLWGTTLPSTEESLQVFVNICDAIINELQRILNTLLIDEKDKKIISNLVVRKSKLLLIRLDLLETFNNHYEELRDLCRPDVRNESTASLGLTSMRQSIIISCVDGIDYLASTNIAEGFISNIDTNKKGGSYHTTNSSSSSDSSNDNSTCDLHPSTGNIMYCCQEILGYGIAYRRMRELINNMNTNNLAIHNKSIELPQMILNPTSIPQDTDDFLMIVLDNLYNILDERSKKFDNNTKNKLFKRELSIKKTKLFDFEDKTSDEVINNARKHLFLSNNLFSVLQHSREIINDKDENTNITNNNNTNNNINTANNKQQPKRRNTVSAANKAQRNFRLAPYIKKIEDRLNIELNAFCDVVSRAIGLHTDDIQDFELKCSKEKPKSTSYNRLLKAKFSVFNTGMDSLLTQQGEWRVSSAGLRDRLSNMLVKVICNTYSTFYLKYSIENFSKKHMDDYLKYPPQVIERQLTGFFGRESSNPLKL